MQKIFAVILCVLLAIGCYRLALIRGRNPRLWFILGLLFGIFALIALSLLPPARRKKVVMQPNLPTPPKKDVLQAKEERHHGKLWYYLDHDNNQFGPMSLQALSKAWEEGKLSLKTYVWHEDLSNWEPIEQVFDLT